MTDHAVLAYGDEGDEGFLPLGDQPNQLGFQWATEGFRVDFLNRGAVAWLLGTYFNHVVVNPPLYRQIVLLLSSLR